MTQLTGRTSGRVIRGDRLGDVAVGKPAGVVNVDPLFVDMVIE